MIVHYCRECDEEYLTHVVACADCGAELVPREEGQPLPADDEPVGLPAGHYEPILHVDSAAELDALVRSLAVAGVPAKVQPSQRGRGFVLGVRAEDQPAALDVLREATGAPEIDAPVDVQPGDERCPACDTRLPADAQECPECGLAVGDDFDVPGNPEERRS